MSARRRSGSSVGARVRAAAGVVVVVTATLGLGACSQVEDAARKVVDEVACRAVSSAAGKLPSATDLDGARMAQAADAAERVDSALSKVPGDRVPASITERVRTAAVDLRQASDSFATDPAGAQAKAQDALDVANSAIDDASQRLGC